MRVSEALTIKSNYSLSGTDTVLQNLVQRHTCTCIDEVPVAGSKGGEELSQHNPEPVLLQCDRVVPQQQELGHKLLADYTSNLQQLG